MRSPHPWCRGCRSARCRGPAAPLRWSGPRPAGPHGRGSWMPGGARAIGAVAEPRADSAGAEPAPRDAPRRSWGSWARPSNRDRAQRLAEAVDGILDVLVVVVLGQRAGAVVAQELLHALAGAGLGGVGDLPPGRQRRAVDRHHELDRQVVVVADPAQLADELLPLDRPLAARHAVVVGHVEVDEVIAG